MGLGEMGLGEMGQNPKLTILGTYNLQTFKHNTRPNKLLLVQFYLFNICSKLRHWK